MASEQNDPVQPETPPSVSQPDLRPSHNPPVNRIAPVSTKSNGKKMGFSDIDEFEYTEQEYNELAKLYDNTFSSIHEGEIVKGKIVAITDMGVAIDIGFKSEGLVPITEFPNIDELKPGDE